MMIRAGTTVLASLCFVAVTVAEGKADCGPITMALKAVEGYSVTIPPAGPDQGWCVLDGLSLRSQTPGWPDLAAERLRLRQSQTEVELDLKGFRATPRATDREVDDRVRSLLRLQSADLRLRAVHDPASEVLSVTGLRLTLTSGAALELDADVRGAGLSLASLSAGAVTRAVLVWRTDGRLLRPVMELAGEDISGATGIVAVDATRAALESVVDALPAATLDDDSRSALAAAVGAMPQGRGRLTLTFLSEDGIGAARLAVAVLSGDPLSPDALGELLAGATITASWQPGLSP